MISIFCTTSLLNAILNILVGAFLPFARPILCILVQLYRAPLPKEDYVEYVNFFLIILWFYVVRIYQYLRVIPVYRFLRCSRTASKEKRIMTNDMVQACPTRVRLRCCDMGTHRRMDRVLPLEVAVSVGSNVAPGLVEPLPPKTRHLKTVPTPAKRGISFST